MPGKVNITMLSSVRYIPRECFNIIYLIDSLAKCKLSHHFVGHRRSYLYHSIPLVVLSSEEMPWMFPVKINNTSTPLVYLKACMYILTFSENYTITVDNKRGRLKFWDLKKSLINHTIWLDLNFCCFDNWSNKIIFHKWLPLRQTSILLLKFSIFWRNYSSYPSQE